MGFSIELLLVIAAIGGAAIFVARRVLRMTKRDQCAPCHGSTTAGPKTHEQGPSAG